jgi:hypothetical protein
MLRAALVFQMVSQIAHAGLLMGHLRVLPTDPVQHNPHPGPNGLTKSVHDYRLLVARSGHRVRLITGAA